MEKNEIKKALYKLNPYADIRKVSKNGIVYEATVGDNQKMTFLIPFNDLGDAEFHAIMQAKHLIRWLI